MQVAPAGPSELSLPYPRLTSLQRQGDRAQSLDEHEYIALLDEAGLCIQKMSLVLGADNQLIISGTTAAKAEAAYVAAALAVMCGRFRKYDGKAAALSMAVSACGKDASSAKDRKDKAEKCGSQGLSSSTRRSQCLIHRSRPSITCSNKAQLGGAMLRRTAANAGVLKVLSRRRRSAILSGSITSRVCV